MQKMHFCIAVQTLTEWPMSNHLLVNSESQNRTFQVRFDLWKGDFAMSTTTYIPGHSSKKTNGKGFFGRLFDRLVDAQSLAAVRKVSDYFRSQPTRQLEDYGFSESEIERLRNGQSLQVKQ